MRIVLGCKRMNLLIGYSMRSGSTLLQHMLGQHSLIQSASDIKTITHLPSIILGQTSDAVVCVKPPDLVFLLNRIPFKSRFKKFVWITRDPRDSYLSSIESGYAYLLWRRGVVEYGIDTGLLMRWKIVYQHYFSRRHEWHLVRYEDLVVRPEQTLANIFEYIEVPYEQVLPFKTKFSLLNGGDYKLQYTDTIHARAKSRWEHEMSAGQQDVFVRHIGNEMQSLGYL